MPVTENRDGKPWTREEFILVLNQYMKMPFAKMSASNPEVQNLAHLMGRSKNSIAFRLVNFAACDPILKARGIKGMNGGGKKCQAFWDEFANDKERLLFEGEKLLAELNGASVEEVHKASLVNIDSNLKGETRQQEIKARVNQDVFRGLILSIYDNKCSLTGIKNTELLIASHIKPWAMDKENRLNPQNGICLSALYDRAFDQGLIGFDSHYKVVLSSKIKQYHDEDYYDKYFGSIDGKALTLPEDASYMPDKTFLEWHMDEIFVR